MLCHSMQCTHLEARLAILLRVRLRVLQRFRAHVVERAHLLLARGARAVGADCLSDAEVDELHHAAHQQEVGWFQVGMRNT